MQVEAGKPFESSDVYTGIADVVILCVNPNLETIEKLNLPVKKEEPTYASKTEEGNDKLMLKFYVKPINLDIIAPITFFLEDKEVVSQSGKFRYINDYGQNTYAESVEEATSRLGKGDVPFFKNEGVRIARVGECELIEFIRAWLSIPMTNTIKFDNFTKIILGNLEEINSLIKKYSATHKVQILLTEKGGYQNVYTKFFGRAGSKQHKWWTNHMDKAQSLPNYQSSFNLKKWDGVSPDAEESTAPTKDFTTSFE